MVKDVFRLFYKNYSARFFSPLRYALRSAQCRYIMLQDANQRYDSVIPLLWA